METVGAEHWAGLAARRYGITAPVEFVSAGANCVFRAGEVVVRVAPASADVRSQVALARWLIGEGFPVATPLADVGLLGDAQVSLWEYVPVDARRPIDYVQLGEIVARLHRVPPSRLRDVVALPFCGDAGWLAIERRLADAEAARAVDADGIAALRAASLALGDWRERAREEPLVVCHGDVHPQNVLMRGDEVVLVDWDAICLGPAAWDHAALMRWADRYGGPARAYPDFAHGYGTDFRASPLANDLAALRLLAATLNVLIGADHVAEAVGRVRYWLGDPDAPAWRAL
jgi:Ser/Thr protein kinase RdoA (MazF antagonist)